MPTTTPSKTGPTLRQVPEHCRYAREQAGFSQVEAAKQIQKSPQLLADIENGRRSATPAVLNAMALVYRCPRGVLEAPRWQQ